MEVCEVTRDEARELIDASGGVVKTAIVMHFAGSSREEAEKLLAANGGVVRRVTKDEPPPIREK
jgi:N-acetylmuramic acid 6-phosphate (MurNAc-6-P) etherase